MGFVKGKSGNPGGRPKDLGEITELARGHGKKCIEVLAALLDHKDAKIRAIAADKLLERGFGKPPQAVEHSGAIDLVTSVNIIRKGNG